MKKKLLLLALLILFVIPVKAQSSPTVLLTWLASPTAGVTYNVYREQAAGACTLTSTGTGPGCLLLNGTPLTALTYTDTTPPAGVQSFYVVRAFNSSGIGSLYSNEISVNLTAPGAPGTLTCTMTITAGVVAGTCK